MAEPNSFEKTYPNIAGWVQDGWVELGRTDYTRSFVRALDEGGLVWEGKPRYNTLEEALQDLEQGIKRWLNGDENDDE